MRAREYSMLFALALIWGISFYFIKIAVLEVSPATTVALRLGFSVATLAVIIMSRPELVRGLRRYWKLGLLVGVINNLIPFVLISWGETRIASGVASILNATTPLFTVLLANWWHSSAREPLTARRGTGVVLGFVGVGVLVGPAALRLSGGGIGYTLGVLAVLVAAASYAVGAILSRRFNGAAILVAPFSCQVSALILVLPIAFVWDPPTHMPSLAALGAVAELGILGTAVAYLIYFWLIRHVGATRTSLVTYLLPCTALIWGALLLGERISWNALAGLMLVLLGTMVTNGTLNGVLRRFSPRPAAAGISR